MKTAVVYISKNGTTQSTVDKMKTVSNSSVTYFNLQETTNIDITSYNKIYIGFGIYAGTLPKPMRTFLENKELEKATTVFFIHALDSADKYNFIMESSVRNNAWMKKSKAYYLGGACDIKKQGFFVKQLLKMIAKKKNLDVNNMTNLDEKAIEGFISDFKNTFGKLCAE